VINPDGFVFVEPASAPTAPIIDDLTRKATALWRSCSKSKHAYRGMHTCTGAGCQAWSDNHDYTTPDGRATHSLLVHYVARHRADVPAADLEFLAGLSVVAEPTASELA
jgi:hypothetical protein